MKSEAAAFMKLSDRVHSGPSAGIFRPEMPVCQQLIANAPVMFTSTAMLEYARMHHNDAPSDASRLGA